MIKDEYSFVIEAGKGQVPLVSQETIQSGDIVVGLTLASYYGVGIVRGVTRDSLCYDVALESIFCSHSTFEDKYNYFNEADHPILFLRKREGRLEVVAANENYIKGLDKLRESHLRKSAEETMRRCR